MSVPKTNGWRSYVITALTSILLTGGAAFVLLGADKVSQDALDRQLGPLGNAVTQLNQTVRNLELTVAVLVEQVESLRRDLETP